MTLTVNGQTREIAGLEDGKSVAALVAALGMQADRVALELNGEIVSRASWAEVAVHDKDRLEIVHFVGGGCR